MYRTPALVFLVALALLCGTRAALALQDITAPVLLEVSFEPQIIDASTGPATLTVTVHDTDDLSGVDWVYLDFRHPSTTQRTQADFSSSDLLEGDALDGKNVETITLPQFSAYGSWELVYFAMGDNVGNRVDLRPYNWPSRYDDIGFVVGEPTPRTTAMFLVYLAAPAAPLEPSLFFSRALLQRCDPNAGVTYISGTVYAHGQPVNGYNVVFSYAPDGPIIASTVSGPHAGYEGWRPGFYSHILKGDGPREGDWYFWIVDNAGARISARAHVHTDGEAAAGKCQQAIIDFDT